MEECAAFRRRVGRRKGGQREDEEVSKKSRWNVMICGDLDESDGSECVFQRDFDKQVQERDTSVMASESAIGEGVTRSQLIPTPGWRNVTKGDSDMSGASTFRVNGEICEEDTYRGEFMRWELLVQI